MALKVEGMVNALRISPDDKTLAIGGSGKTLHFMNTKDYKLLYSVKTHKSSITGMAWVNDQTLATSSNDKTV